MASPPGPKSWFDKQIPPVDDMNEAFYDVWKFLLNPPMVKARQTTVQTLTTGVSTAIIFQTEDIDTNGFHSSTTNPTRFTPNISGYYVGYAGVSFTVSSVGRREVRVRKNGGDYISKLDTNTPVTVGNIIQKGVAFGPEFFNGTTDYVEVYGVQTSGGNLNTEVGSGTSDYEEQSEFYMRWFSL